MAEHSPDARAAQTHRVASPRLWGPVPLSTASARRRLRGLFQELHQRIAVGVERLDLRQVSHPRDLDELCARDGLRGLLPERGVIAPVVDDEVIRGLAFQVAAT